jgi:ABC-type antimicrobial peptide transport system permease subunit
VIVETLALAIVAALVAGAYPAWRISRLSAAQALRGE